MPEFAEIRLRKEVDALKGEQISAYVKAAATPQGTPTPDRCPECNSADRSGHITAWAGLEAVYCQDSFHSSATKSRSTGISLDGGKTIHSKFKND